MSALEAVAWTPPPISTPRLALRPAVARDRPAFIELLAPAEVNAYLGGPRPAMVAGRPQDWDRG